MAGVVVADRSPVVRFGLRTLLGSAGDLSWAGECESAEDALLLNETLRPELLVVGTELAGSLSAVELSVLLKGTPRPPRLLVYAQRDLDGEAAGCLFADADSLVHESRPCDELLDAIRRTAAGQRVWRLAGGGSGGPPCLQSLGFRLSCKEREVAGLVLRRMSNEEISSALHVSLPTVKSHVKSVLRKCGVRRRTDLL
ncbi:Response regulator containing a CheY-like receiver domain and an HTH DNA-binding domain (plasmid) [Rubrobacter radiotolerans]|uniref:Response regulator containing a CheY-like receiver domain and an HTH DNA-binding domain n=1 Tax=Rubrobacter radiotolerans TaxID=42256 RepID=A0A023X7K6_RUBRA|nr:Response regulator containing a CheY-like receiver domain and an HTH DNA-binding domain [Rubrobacter radiotolerans]